MSLETHVIVAFNPRTLPLYRQCVCVVWDPLFDGSLSSPWSRLPLSMVHKVGGLRLRSGVWHSSAQSSGSGLSSSYTVALLDASVAV